MHQSEAETTPNSMERRHAVQLAICLPLIGLIGACTGNVVDGDRFRSVTPGMSRGQVVQALGDPDSSDRMEILGLVDGEAMSFRNFRERKIYRVFLAKGFVVSTGVAQIF